MLDPRNRARNPRGGKKGDAEEMPEKADSQGYPVKKMFSPLEVTWGATWKLTQPG